MVNSPELILHGSLPQECPLVKAAIQLLAAGKPAKIKDRNIGGRLVARVKDICQKQQEKEEVSSVVEESPIYSTVRLGEVYTEMRLNACCVGITAD